MHHFETVLALLVGVAFLALLARRLAVPTPALFVAGGLLVALLPGLPAVQFDPQLVFLVFIPPLLYRASLLASYRDVRANLRPILLLGVGHVLFVTIVVAWVASRRSGSALGVGVRARRRRLAAGRRRRDGVPAPAAWASWRRGSISGASAGGSWRPIPACRTPVCGTWSCSCSRGSSSSLPVWRCGPFSEAGAVPSPGTWRGERSW